MVSVRRFYVFKTINLHRLLVRNKSKALTLDLLNFFYFYNHLQGPALRSSSKTADYNEIFFKHVFINPQDPRTEDETPVIKKLQIVFVVDTVARPSESKCKRVSNWCSALYLTVVTEAVTPDSGGRIGYIREATGSPTIVGSRMVWRAPRYAKHFLVEGFGLHEMFG